MQPSCISQACLQSTFSWTATAARTRPTSSAAVKEIDARSNPTKQGSVRIQPASLATKIDTAAANSPALTESAVTGAMTFLRSRQKRQICSSPCQNQMTGTSLARLRSWLKVKMPGHNRTRSLQNQEDLDSEPLAGGAFGPQNEPGLPEGEHQEEEGGGLAEEEGGTEGPPERAETGAEGRARVRVLEKAWLFFHQNIISSSCHPLIMAKSVYETVLFHKHKASAASTAREPSRRTAEEPGSNQAQTARRKSSSSARLGSSKGSRQNIVCGETALQQACSKLSNVTFLVNKGGFLTIVRQEPLQQSSSYGRLLNLPLEQRNRVWAEYRERNKIRIRQDCMADLMQSCSFRPKLTRTQPRPLAELAFSNYQQQRRARRKAGDPGRYAQ